MLALSVSSSSRSLQNLEIGSAACFFIYPLGSVHSVPDLPTVGFSKLLEIKHVVQHLHRVRTLNPTGACILEQGKEQTRFKKASGIRSAKWLNRLVHHLTTSHQAFPIEQSHFWPFSNSGMVGGGKVAGKLLSWKRLHHDVTTCKAVKVAELKLSTPIHETDSVVMCRGTTPGLGAG